MWVLTRHRKWAAALAAAVLGWTALGGICPAGAQNRSNETGIEGIGGPESASSPPEVHLYFAEARKGFLKAETRILPGSDHPAETGRKIVEQLIRGPQSRLMPTVPPHARLLSFYLAPGGRAYANWGTEIRDDHPGGARMEMLTLFSIVNSLVLNVPEIHSVSLLIDGREADTLAGHIDLRQPFNANMLIIR